MIEFDIQEFTKDAERVLQRAGRNVDKAIGRVLTDIGLLVVRDSRRNAPRSPSKAQYRRTLKTAKGRANSKFRATPGGLESAIRSEIHGGAIDIVVPLNSVAGKYAKRMHDERGKTWWNRGPGTRAKGPQAGERFILRAISANMNSGKIEAIFDHEMKRWTRGGEA